MSLSEDFDQLIAHCESLKSSPPTEVIEDIQKILDGIIKTCGSDGEAFMPRHLQRDSNKTKSFWK